MRSRMIKLLALAALIVALGATALCESTMDQLRAIRKSAEDGIAEITAPTPEPSVDPATTPTPAVPTPTPVYEPLEKGAKGEAVKRLQRQLIALGFLSGSDDGSFGPMTEQAVKDFQTREGLVITGVADQETQARLFAYAVPEVISYEQLDYRKLSEDMPAFMGRLVQTSGTVMQVLTDDGSDDPRGVYTVLRLATKGHSGDVLYVSGFRAPGARAIIEGEALTIQGVVKGWETYRSVSGTYVQLPWIEAERYW